MCCWPLRTPTAEFIVNCQFANEVSLGKCNLLCHFLFKCIYLIKPSRSVILKNEFTHFFFQIPRFFQKNFQKFSYPQNPENSSNFYENVISLLKFDPIQWHIPISLGSTLPRSFEEASSVGREI